MNEHVWPCISYADAHRAIGFLKEAFGFEATIVAPGETRPVEHAELLTPWGGGIMCGSHQPGDSPFASLPPGSAAVYVVVDDPDALFARATAAGCEVVRPLRDEESYDQRGFSVRDLEGNIWSFGTYPGEARSATAG